MSRTQIRRTKQHIMSWGSGTHAPAASPGGAAATIALAEREHLAAVLESGLSGPGTVILAPGESDPENQVVGYDGYLSEPGADLSIGDDFFLQTQDYASSAFMSVLGPTLIRITDGDDFAAFLADVDRARSEGVFPDFAVAPSVLIADIPALGGPADRDGPGLRLHVDGEGTVSTSPGGSALGSVGATFSELQQAWTAINDAGTQPCAVCLGAVVAEPVRVAGRAGRPALPRYLAAVDALKMLTANDLGGMRVSGFGERLTAGLPLDDDAADLLDPTVPVVLWNPDQAYVHDRGRVFAVDRTTARAVECLLVAGPDAGAYLPRSVTANVESWFAERGVTLTPGRIAVGAR